METGYKKNYAVIHILTPIKLACLNPTEYTAHAYMHTCADTFTPLKVLYEIIK